MSENKNPGVWRRRAPVGYGGSLCWPARVLLTVHEEVRLMTTRIIEFATSLSETEVMAVAEERADQFRALPRLEWRYYVAIPSPGEQATPEDSC